MESTVVLDSTTDHSISAITTEHGSEKVAKNYKTEPDGWKRKAKAKYKSFLEGQLLWGDHWGGFLT